MPNSGRPDARLRLISVLLFMLLMTSCVPLPPAPAAGNDSRSTPSRGLVIYAPATPSSIPILLAARHIEGAQVTIFNNHTQANAQFLRGDIDILVTGLSVGLDLFKNGAPVQVIDSYVAGVTYLVTSGKKVERFADLKGETIYIPFEGSPIEETTRFFIEREGLIWKKDILVAYAPFTSSVELLKQGKATAVALPEPSVSVIEKVPNLFVSLSYRRLWDEASGSSSGYPQVTPFVNRTWAAGHPDVIQRFNEEVAAALGTIQNDPAKAVAETHEAMGLPAPVLSAALARTDFAFTSGDALAQEIHAYYQAIGKPLDESFDAFFYRGPQ